MRGDWDFYGACGVLRAGLLVCGLGTFWSGDRDRERDSARLGTESRRLAPQPYTVRDAPCFDVLLLFFLPIVSLY